MLWKHYCNTQGNVQFPEGLRFKEIVEHAFIIDENLKKKIIGLNKIYCDLINHGTGSIYFVHILDTYGRPYYRYVVRTFFFTMHRTTKVKRQDVFRRNVIDFRRTIMRRTTDLSRSTKT
jgi:hypothetical protein